ncbi:MAG: hypothetical protein SFX73_01895 [Kofleriaceae bacterium]|nr:hypothetical protein [Kofleriaceae bacterium]
MKVKTPESVMTTSFLFLMPLTFASNIFVGLGAMATVATIGEQAAARGFAMLVRGYRQAASRGGLRRRVFRR